MFDIGSRVLPGTSKLIEECAEVTQVCAKLLAMQAELASYVEGTPIPHYDGSDLRARLQDELGDLLAACGFVIDHCGLDTVAINKRMVEKRQTFERWQAEQRALREADGGTVDAT